MKNKKRPPFRNVKRAQRLGITIDQRLHKEVPKHSRGAKTEPKRYFHRALGMK